MKTILSGKASKLLDKYTIEYIGIPSLVLMERAALKVAHEIDDHQKKETIYKVIYPKYKIGSAEITPAPVITPKPTTPPSDDSGE